MDTLVDYTNPLLDSYRSSTHDAILVYGFIPDRANDGVFKTSFTLQDGLKYGLLSEPFLYILSDWGAWSDCSTTCDVGVRSRSRTCAFDPQWSGAEGSEDEQCNIATCKIQTFVLI